MPTAPKHEYLVEDLIPTGIFEDTGKLSPIHVAAIFGNTLELFNLLNKKGDPNKLDKRSGTRPIDFAALQGNHIVIGLLIEYGADVADVVNKNAGLMTPLHLWALKYNDQRSLDLLIEAGADKNRQDVNGDTPLHIAAARGNAPAVKMLIDKGADVDIVDENGKTALHENLIGNPDDEIISLLLENGADVNARTPDNTTALHFAPKYSRPETISLLIAKGAKVNTSDNDGNTPLHVICGLSHTKFDEEIVLCLIKHGADVNATKKDGKTPLHSAIFSGSTAAANALISKKANLNALLDFDGAGVFEVYQEAPLLFFAVAMRNPQIAKTLLENGADPNGADKGNMMLPLQWAVNKDQTDMVALLLEKGADAKQENLWGNSALSAANKLNRKGRAKNISAIMELFKKHGVTE